MHDPAEMIKKITELEGSLPNVNRPENLYARSHLLMAETNAKMLYVFIDIAKEIKELNQATQKLLSILTTPTLNMVVENENTKQQIEAEGAAVDEITQAEEEIEEARHEAEFEKEDSGQDLSPNDTVEDNEADGLGEFEESTK